MCLMRKEMSLAVLCPSDSSSLKKKKSLNKLISEDFFGF